MLFIVKDVLMVLWMGFDSNTVNELLMKMII